MGCAFCKSVPLIPKQAQISSTHYGVRGSIPCWFKLWRMFLLALMTWISALSLHLYNEEDKLKYYGIYLTFWVQTMCLITCIFRFFSTAFDMFCGSSCIKCVYPIQSVLTRATLPAVTLVMVNYWTMVFEGFEGFGTLNKVSAIQIHGVNALFMWIDYLLSLELIHYQSVIWPVLFGLVYQGWILIFEFVDIPTLTPNGQDQNTNADGMPYIYKSADWSKDWQKALSMWVITNVVLIVISVLATLIKNCILKRKKHEILFGKVPKSEREYDSDLNWKV